MSPFQATIKDVLLKKKKDIKNWLWNKSWKIGHHFKKQKWQIIFPQFTNQSKFNIQNFSSVYLQRNVRSTFQADIYSLNLTWLSPACVCSFFPRLEYYLLTQFEMSSQNQKRLFFYHEFHKWNKIFIWVFKLPREECKIR